MAEQIPGANRDHLWDAENLSKTALRKKYPSTYNSWRNGKKRAGQHWHPDFADWLSFFRIMGPAGPGETLDRTDNDDPRYGPGLCEWKDKKAQAANRYSTWRKDGETLDVIAARTGSDTRTLRAGMRRENPFGANPLAFKPWPLGKEDWWERRYKSGANRSKYRYEYLIHRLAQQQALEEQWAQDHDDDFYSDDPIKRAAAEARARLHNRLIKTLVRARIDYEVWLPFAAKFIRRHPNLGKDGQTRLSPDDDDWD